MDAVVEKSKNKAAKKIAKKKKKGKKSWLERMQESANNNPQASKLNSNMASASLKSYSSNTMNSSNGTTKYKAGSLAAKANAMQRYQNNNGGK